MLGDRLQDSLKLHVFKSRGSLVETLSLTALVFCTVVVTSRTESLLSVSSFAMFVSWDEEVWNEWYAKCMAAKVKPDTTRTATIAAIFLIGLQRVAVFAGIFSFDSIPILPNFFSFNFSHSSSIEGRWISSSFFENQELDEHSRSVGTFLKFPHPQESRFSGSRNMR